MIFEQIQQAVELLAPFFQIAASVGVLFGIVTAIIGLRRYQAEKEKDRAEKEKDRAQRDKDYLSALRKSIFVSRPIFEELNHLLKYELFYEMASNVANSTPVSMGINDVYDATNKYLEHFKYLIESGYFASNYNYSHYSGSEDIRKFLRDNLHIRWKSFGVRDLEFMDNLYLESAYRPNERSSSAFFPVPLRPKLVELFKNYTSKIGTEIEPYRFDYPTLSRVLLSANRFFESLEDKYRRHALNVDHWAGPIADAGQELLYAGLYELYPRLVEQAQQAQAALLAREAQLTPTPVEELASAQEQTESEEQTSAQEQIDPVMQGSGGQQNMQNWIGDEMNAIRGPDQLKDRVTQQVAGNWYMGTYWQDADAIDAVLEIVQIVTRTYLSKSDEELLSIGTEEKKLRFTPMEQTPMPEQMLQEAFDGLKPVLTEFDRESYHHLAKRIGKSNPHSS